MSGLKYSHEYFIKKCSNTFLSLISTPRIIVIQIEYGRKGKLIFHLQKQLNIMVRIATLNVSELFFSCQIQNKIQHTEDSYCICYICLGQEEIKNISHKVHFSPQDILCSLLTDRIHHFTLANGISSFRLPSLPSNKNEITNYHITSAYG